MYKFQKRRRKKKELGGTRAVKIIKGERIKQTLAILLFEYVHGSRFFFQTFFLPFKAPVISTPPTENKKKEQNTGKGCKNDDIKKDPIGCSLVHLARDWTRRFLSDSKKKQGNIAERHHQQRLLLWLIIFV